MAGPPEHLDVALRLGQVLDAAGVSHMVTGSLASSIHEEPRSTYDVDVILRVVTGGRRSCVRRAPT